MSRSGCGNERNSRVVICLTAEMPRVAVEEAPQGSVSRPEGNIYNEKRTTWTPAMRRSLSINDSRFPSRLPLLKNNSALFLLQVRGAPEPRPGAGWRRLPWTLGSQERV